MQNIGGHYDNDETLNDIANPNDQRAHTQVLTEYAPFDVLKQDTLDQKDRAKTHSTVG